MMQRILPFVLVFLIAFASAQAQQRVALVIGNQQYVHAPRLDGASRDARAMARALRDLGFSVNERPDLDLAGMRGALREFEVKANVAAVALVYYAGHGLQLARGVVGDNYLVPTDAKLMDARDVEDETISLSRLLERLEGAQSRIVVLDACRDNPLATRMRNTSAGRSVGRGLAPLAESNKGTLVVFSTAPGQIAKDNTGSGNGPFTISLLRHLATPGLEVRQMLTRVRAETSRLTNGKQVPWNDDGLFEEVYLAGELPKPEQEKPTSGPLASLEAAERDAEHFSRAGNGAELERYIRECRTPCAYRSVAMSQVEALKERDAEGFSRAQGNWQEMTRYIEQCGWPCAYKEIVKSQLASMKNIR